MKRLEIVVLVADDLAPEMRATIEATVSDALDKFFIAFGGELHLGDFHGRAPGGHITTTRSYAGPRKAKAS